jgi:GAF domain-containing protein
MIIDLDPTERTQWREMLDNLAEIINVPVALIMRIDEDDIEVFETSKGDQNPYKPGDRETLEKSGLYCEWVIKNRARLRVPNALKDKNWDQNPDIKLGMVSYLGFPVIMPDSAVFGTICLLDNKEQHFTPIAEKVLANFRDMLERHLLCLHQRNQLMKTIHGILPICAGCRKIRDKEGNWHSIEAYIRQRSSAEFSHGVCPDCLTLFS